MNYKLLILIIFAFQTNFIICQKQKIHKENLITPPNGIQLYDNVFIDKTEITNQNYLEYMFYIVKDSMKINFFHIYGDEFGGQKSMKAYYSNILNDTNFKSLMLDTTCWENFKSQNDTTQKGIFNYLYDPIYRHHPVIGISYEQALACCKWRGNVVTALFDTEEYKEKYHQLRKFKYVIEYRLPTKSEWEYAAKGGLNISDYPYGSKKITKNKNVRKLTESICGTTELENSFIETKRTIKEYKFNIYEDFDSINLNMTKCKMNYYFDLEKATFKSLNGYKIHNMLGNVSEMMMEEGICKGGSFFTEFKDLSITKDITYDKPTEWLGFRCIAIVHKTRR